MMKRFITGLLILIVGIGGVFATNPDAVSFQVQTEVAGINLMKITATEFTGTTESALTNAPAFKGPFTVNTYGAQNDETTGLKAYISTLSNNRVGYTVTMSATPMTSTQSLVDAYIHYTVTANGKSVDTSGMTGGPGAGGKVIIDTTGGMPGVASQSHAITLSVEQNSFEAAVEGTYTGTVTFTWNAT